MLLMASALALRSAALPGAMLWAARSARVARTVVVATTAATGLRKSAWGARVLKPSVAFIRLANRELRYRTSDRLAFNPRKLRANQRSMQAYLVWGYRRLGSVRWSGGVRIERRRTGCGFSRGNVRVLLHGLEDLTVRRFHRCWLLPKAGGLSTLVWVLRLACGAAGESNFIADHGDDCVVGEAAFARTIIVQNVTKP